MTNFTGLLEDEVNQKKLEGKQNNFKPATSRSYSDIFSENVFNFINIVFFIIGILLILVGRFSDAFVYVGVILFNSFIGSIQEIKAKIQLDKIALLTNPQAKIIRNSQEIISPISEIVLDDLLRLEAGDLIPVDGEILEGTVQVDESLITGEADTVTKIKGQKLSSGTYLISGNCYLKVTEVGLQTIANQITEGAKSYKKNLTPMQREINLSVRILVIFAFVLVFFITISGILSGTSLNDSLPITAVVAGIVPNSLFVMINLAYALGAVRLSGKGVLVQQLNAIESLSNVDILCVDKTGTLTTNHILLEQVYPIKTTLKNAEKALGDFVSTATSTTPTSEAVSKKFTGNNLNIVEEVLFSSVYKWSGFSYKEGRKSGTYVFGAPEVILSQRHLNKADFNEDMRNFQNQGFRVLMLFHSKKVLALHKKNLPHIPDELEPVAMVTFKNELRNNVREVLESFKKAGVKIRIISGDNTNTVLALARQVGFEAEEDETISGRQLEEMNEAEIARILPKIKIFGRITPKQKAMLVGKFKEAGNYVAMIGDGVNDVLSLKAANLGIAMQSGSQVTRSVADMLLLKDSFSALPYSLLEGQRIRNAVSGIFSIFFTRIMYLLIIMMAVSIIGLPFPFTIKQNSLISLLTSGIATFGLTIWSKPGKPKKQSLISTSLSFVVPASVSIAIFAVFLYLFYGYYQYVLNFGFGADITTASPEVLANLINKIIPLMRTVLSSFLILSGLTLIIFISSPTKWFSMNDKPTRNWMPAILGVVLICSFFYLINQDYFISFWELAKLSVLEIAVVTLTVLTWLFTLKQIWKNDLLSKILGLK
jgi:cation-transporting ATPase E